MSEVDSNWLRNTGRKSEWRLGYAGGTTVQAKSGENQQKQEKSGSTIHSIVILKLSPLQFLRVSSPGQILHQLLSLFGCMRVRE